MKQDGSVRWYIPDEILEIYKEPLKHSLSTEENMILFKKWHDENDPTAREKLILGNIKLVFKCSRKYIPLDVAYTNDDIISIGMIGLIRAVDTYDYQKGYAFSSYAFKIVSGELTRLWKKYLRENLITSLDAKITEVLGMDDTITTFVDTIEDPSARYDLQLQEDAEYVALQEVIRFKLDELKEVQQKEIMMYFGLDDYPQMSIREIAKVRGVSFQAVQMSLARSLKKLRTAIHLYLKFE